MSHESPTNIQDTQPLPSSENVVGQSLTTCGAATKIDHCPSKCKHEVPVVDVVSTCLTVVRGPYGPSVPALPAPVQCSGRPLRLWHALVRVASLNPHLSAVWHALVRVASLNPHLSQVVQSAHQTWIPSDPIASRRPSTPKT